MDGRVPKWVRLGMALTLALPQLVTGLWAVVASRDWFERFPGADPRLVAAEPPFNAHLATDAGAGFLATGIAIALAALWARRSGVYVALGAYLAFALPHTVYHAANPAPGLTGAEDVVNVVMLASGLILAGIFAWGARPGRPVELVRSGTGSGARADVA